MSLHEAHRARRRRQAASTIAKPVDAKLQRWIDLLAALLSRRYGAGATPGEREPIDRVRARLRAAIVAMPERAARDNVWYASSPALPNDHVVETLRACAKDLAKARMGDRRGDAGEFTDEIKAHGVWVVE